VKRNHLPIALLISAAAFISIGCASSQNSNGNTNMVAAATPQPTPDKAAIESELAKIENDWPRIVKERDAAAVQKLEADDIILVYPDGADGAKEEDVKDIESGALAADPQEISDITVKVLDNDSAIVRSRTTVKSDRYKITDGKCQVTIHDFRSVDTFARRNGQWQLVASATVPVRNSSPTSSTSPTPKPSPSAKPSPSIKPSPVVKASPVAKPSPAKPAAKPSPPRVVVSPIKTKTP
jgi:ketosteroid isomerase-like protein